MVFTYVHSGRPLARCYPKMRCRLKANHFTMPNLPPEPWTRLSFSRNGFLHYFGVDLQLICIRLQQYPSKTTTDQPINRHRDPPGDGRRRGVGAVAFPSIPHRLGRPFLQLFSLMFLAERVRRTNRMTRATSMLEDAEVMCHDNVLRKRGVRVNAVISLPSR